MFPPRCSLPPLPASLRAAQRQTSPGQPVAAAPCPASGGGSGSPSRPGSTIARSTDRASRPAARASWRTDRRASSDKTFVGRRRSRGADEVLAAFAAREREIRGLCAHAARQQHQQLRVFVVGVRADHEHALVAAELAQGGSQRSDAAGAGRSHLSTRHAGGAEAQQEPDDEGFHYWERYTAPPFITNFTRCSSVISRVGSPATAMISAYSPGAIAPTFCSWPSSAAATEVPD